MTQSKAYSDAGVDIDAGERFADMIKALVAKAWGSGDEIGGFAGGGPIPLKVRKVAGSVDGTGTKAILAALANNHDGIGIDAVAMGAVDMYVAGYSPAFALDVLNVAALVPNRHIQVIESVIRGCQMCGCRLIGGETAELPDMFPANWMFNLDVTVIGFDNPDAGEALPVEPGQLVLGWNSNGVASNGFSLVRKIFGFKGPDWRPVREMLACEYDQLDGEPISRHLLRPTPIWIPNVETQKLRGVEFSRHAHITGGGLPGNIPRILPPHCRVMLDRSAWTRPPIFRLIQDRGGLADEEMDPVFNQGIMMVSLVPRDGVQCNDPNARVIGMVQHREGNEPQVKLVNRFPDDCGD
ncbi:MAG: AIR synthase-related protein [Candidatus Kerfeldbacteria bacterium]